jgi:hypothetical protein
MSKSFAFEITLTHALSRSTGRGSKSIARSDISLCGEQ